ncbi:MAG: hypothetical protein ACKOSQ_10120 [Planctomycetaceae bacterium]
MSTAVAGAADVGRAAAALRAARRVLVTGPGTVAAETAARACDLAEAVGAAVDFGGLDTAQVAGPTIARIGAVTADPEELRDRADLVVFWFCDPDTAPGFVERFVTPATAAGRPRHLIAVGPHAVVTSAATGRHVRVAADRAVDLARLLHAAVAGRAVPAGPLAAERDALEGAIDTAGCAAFVTDHRDPVGLEPWSLLGLVRALAHAKPAFEVPLVPAGATAAVSTWRYGAAGAIARADRHGAEFRPAECDAARLVARGEVDVVVAVGSPAPEVEAAIAARGTALAVIRIAGDDATQRSRLDALVAAVRGGLRDGGAA